MEYSTIDFSAQFGGQDAADALLPHFRALKSSARELKVKGFPLPKLAFILRVDGDVHQFGFCGPLNIDLDRRGEYLSIEIGIPRADRGRIAPLLKKSFAALPAMLRQDGRLRAIPIDYENLSQSLDELLARYCNTRTHENEDNIGQES